MINSLIVGLYLIVSSATMPISIRIHIDNLVHKGQPAPDGLVMVLNYNRQDYTALVVQGAVDFDVESTPEFELNGGLSYHWEDEKASVAQQWRTVQVGPKTLPPTRNRRRAVAH